MFFRRRVATPVVERPVAAFVYQLSNEEMQQRANDIEHIGAVVDIKSVKKEDTLMVEKLKAYLAELELKKATLESPLDLSGIDAEVAAYREKLIAEAEAKRVAEVAKVNSDIACIGNIIVREEEAIAAAAVVAEAPVDGVVTE